MLLIWIPFSRAGAKLVPFEFYSVCAASWCVWRAHTGETLHPFFLLYQYSYCGILQKQDRTTILVLTCDLINLFNQTGSQGSQGWRHHALFTTLQWCWQQCFMSSLCSQNMQWKNTVTHLLYETEKALFINTFSFLLSKHNLFLSLTTFNALLVNQPRIICSNFKNVKIYK